MRLAGSWRGGGRYKGQEGVDTDDLLRRPLMGVTERRASSLGQWAVAAEATQRFNDAVQVSFKVLRP